MLTLAIDCSLRRINLGASGGENFLGELGADVGTRQSELLPGAVRDFLAIFGKSPLDITRVAATVGPGYYTGIRVGLSYAAALAESVGASLSGVSTLRAVALPLIEALSAARAAAVVTPVIQASRETIYAAMYGISRDGEKTLIPPTHASIAEFMETVEKTAGELIIIGNDVPAELRERHKVLPALSVGRGVLLAAKDEPAADPADIRAVYLRPPY